MARFIYFKKCIILIVFIGNGSAFRISEELLAFMDLLVLVNQVISSSLVNEKTQKS